MAEVRAQQSQMYKIPTYEELIDYIERDPYKIKYPNRSAKFLRNSFQLSFLDHYTTETLNVQQENALKQQIAKAEISKAAAENGKSSIDEAYAFKSLENTPAQTAQSASSSQGMLAGMPQGKPPQDPQREAHGKATVGASASSSGEISANVGGNAYPPQPPAPKAKASPIPATQAVKPNSQWTPSPEEKSVFTRI